MVIANGRGCCGKGLEWKRMDSCVVPCVGGWTGSRRALVGSVVGNELEWGGRKGVVRVKVEGMVEG